MKVGDLVRHYRNRTIGIIVAIERNRCYRQTTRWKVVWGKQGHIGWMYDSDLFEVINESR